MCIGRAVLCVFTHACELCLGAQFTTSATVNWVGGDVAFNAGTWSHTGTSTLSVLVVGGQLGAPGGGIINMLDSSSITSSPLSSGTIKARVALAVNARVATAGGWLTFQGGQYGNWVGTVNVLAGVLDFAGGNFSLASSAQSSQAG